MNDPKTFRGPADHRGLDHGSLPFDARFRAILDALPVGLFILASNGSPVYANTYSTELLGMGPVEGLTTKDLAAAYSAFVAGTEEPYPDERMPIVKALRGERAFINDMEIRKKDEKVYLHVEAAPVLDTDGKVVYAIAIFRDITPTKVMESELQSLVHSLELQAIAQEARLQKIKGSPAAVGELVADVAGALRRAREDARVAQNALSLFLANFSHELRTPLNHIIGFSDLIDQKISRGVTADIGSHAANIRESGSALLDTLNRVIQFAELETGALEEPDLEIFSLDDLLGELIEWAVPLADQHGIEISMRIEEPIGTMRSDSSFIQTGLRQIVENACKHSGGGGVRMEARRLGDDADARVEITIADSGPGIDEALAKALLEGKVSPGDPLRKGGLGVGIPLAKKLFEGLGGGLSLEAGEGGSTFKVDLPVLFRLPESQA